MKDGFPGILVLTSSFPHQENPAYGVFIRDFARSVSVRYRVIVLAPKFAHPAKTEDGFQVRYFSQCCLPWSRLAGRPGGILPALKRNPLLWLFLPFFLFSEFIALVRTVKTEKIGIIHAHWLLPQGFIAAVYKHFFNRRLKLIVTCHGSDINKVGGGAMDRLKRFVFANADKVVAVSADLAAKVSRLAPEVLCEVQPMGIDTELFSPAATCVPEMSVRFGLKTRPVLFVGSLIESKGVRELIEAWAKVKLRCVDAELLLVGGGELQPELLRLAEALGIADSVHFAGMLPHDELPGIFAGSAVFVLPSHSEGFAQVVYEALACGTSAVVCRLPVFEALPDAARLFTFCEVGDPESLAEALREALSTPVNNAFGRQYVLEKLSQHLTAERYCRFYAELMGGAAAK